MFTQKPNVPIPFLPCDTTNKWAFGAFQIRLENWGKRFNILPLLGIDWEVGMGTIIFGWLNIAIAFDYDFYPEWKQSDEASTARLDPRNEGLDI